MNLDAGVRRHDKLSLRLKVRDFNHPRWDIKDVARAENHRYDIGSAARTLAAFLTVIRYLTGSCQAVERSRIVLDDLFVLRGGNAAAVFQGRQRI